jgi:sphingolipid delta-4 desaturase
MTIKSTPSPASSTKPYKYDFTWSETDEPHATRRKEILEKHPEIYTLFTKEPRTFLIVLAIVIAQIASAVVVKDLHWGWLVLWAYAFGGTVNHSLQLAVHELSHNLCWKSDIANKLTALLANTVTGFPSAITFQRYHLEHHMYQGVDGIDTDVPTLAEVRFFNSAPRKALWMFLQPAFYALRPLFVKPKTPTKWELINWVTQMSFNVAIVYTLGGKALAYFFIGTLLGLGLHPVAGHFVAEHYEFTNNIETYSYYGCLNRVNFNVGYHNEHHDFPRIPWSNLPKVKKIAPEFYDKLPHYTSYVAVIWRYITDPTVGPSSRIKRLAKRSAALKDAKDAKAAA